MKKSIIRTKSGMLYIIDKKKIIPEIMKVTGEEVLGEGEFTKGTIQITGMRFSCKGVFKFQDKQYGVFSDNTLKEF